MPDDLLRPWLSNVRLEELPIPLFRNANVILFGLQTISEQVSVEFLPTPKSGAGRISEGRGNVQHLKNFEPKLLR